MKLSVEPARQPIRPIRTRPYTDKPWWHGMTWRMSFQEVLSLPSSAGSCELTQTHLKFETRARFAASLCARIWLGVAVFRTNSLSLIVVYKTFYRNLQNLFKSISLRISCSLLMFSPVKGLGMCFDLCKASGQLLGTSESTGQWPALSIAPATNVPNVQISD